MGLNAWLTSTTTETAIVDKPANADEHDHGHRYHHHWNALHGAPPVYRLGCFVC
jgi:hypothetical protein